MKPPYVISLRLISLLIDFLRALPFGHLAQVMPGLILKKHNFHQMLNSLCQHAWAETWQLSPSQNESPLPSYTAHLEPQEWSWPLSQ